MTNYFHIHHGNLYPGDIAKAEDIMEIQQRTQDMSKEMLDDLHERQGCILGGEENAFILTPESKRNSRFIDQMNLANGEDGHYLSIRETDYRQPIKLSKSSVYSIKVKLQNKSEKEVPVTFELHDVNENLIEGKRTTLNLPAKTDPTEFEIIFDLDYYPTAHGVDHKDLEDNVEGIVIPPNNDEDTEGIDHGEDVDYTTSSLGASVIYFVVKALNKNKFDVNQADGDYVWNDEDPTFGILMNKNSSYGQLLEENNGSGFVQSSVPGDLFFEEIFTNYQSYRCEPGEALIGGEKVFLADTHVSVDGASSYGDVLSYVYMDIDGHLKVKNSDPYIGARPPLPIVEEPHLHIANIISFADATKDPIIEQDDTNQETRPRSHHERLRRLEKQMLYTQDIAIPPRLKYTLTGEDWIDQNPEQNITAHQFNSAIANTLDALKKGGYVITTDADGNFIVKVTKAESFNIPITLKDSKSGIVDKKQKTKILKSAQTSAYINKINSSDIARAQVFSEIKNMKVDVTNGILTLDSNTSGDTFAVATNKKEAKETEFNPWDDSAKNRPSSSKIKPITRSYTVTSGKNGKNDWASEFPAMTLYAKSTYKLTKLEIPIHKFKNCSAVKFMIYKRQENNNKENTVWLQKRIKVSNEFSLKKAKVKNGYQYMDDGFTWNFGKKGLTLEKGQYVIIALPIVKSGTGTIYVETYKPGNSRDFCIRYYGAANASHFLLKSRYQEIWYNSAKAYGEEISYDTKGSITSGTITWTNKEPIKTIKPTANITKPKGTSYKLEVDVGNGWEELDIGKVNTIKSGKDSFRWRLTFNGNKKETPTLKYNKNKKYALNFEIIRATPNAANSEAAGEIDKNLCITSKPFIGNEILREYLGDMNFGLSENKLSNFEFARVWATDNTEEELRIDLSGCDRADPIYNNTHTEVIGYYNVYSMHYVDLKLKDFNSGSVDYSNYTAQMEIDEHNMRLKLDTDYAYNDDDIRLINVSDFKVTNDDYKLDAEGEVGINLTSVPESESNVTLMKARFNNTMNLAQYDAIKIGLALDGSVGGSIKGLGVYVSSTYEETTPSNLANEPDEDAILVDELPDLNASQQETIDKYANRIIKRFEPINGTGMYVYYQSTWDYDEDSQSGKWVWNLMHIVKSYNIYKFADRITKSSELKITADNNGKTQYFEIDIDPDQVNLQYAKEIGIVLLNDEGVAITNVNSIKVKEFIVVQKDYYPVFEASKGNKFVIDSGISSLDTATKSNASGSISKVGTTEPPTSQIAINYNYNSNDLSGRTIATFDATSKSTANYNHIGIQMASDCLIVKDMLELHLIKVDENTKVEKVIDKVRLPTNNYMYYATNSEKKINLVQVFKKLETNDRFDKIALVATPHFIEYAKKLKTVGGALQNGIDGNKTISLFIGNIVLYQARTIPMFHPRMRMKFYFDQAKKDDLDHISIRKIGVVADYQ